MLNNDRAVGGAMMMLGMKDVRELYVSDGYGNCRVHLFSPTGELKRSWGVPGQ